jgi:N6-adenosine-specific RNA methylase IME4
MDKYHVIVADPAWQYDNYTSAAHGAPQYPTMTFEELCELPVQDWADKNCLLALWCTWPMMPQGVKLVEKWGFEYITGWPWIKTLPDSGTIRCGTGFWSQSVSEYLILARKGKVSPPKGNKRRGLLIEDNRQFYGPINKHSTKPEDIQTWIEDRFAGPYLELFARRNRPGWTCWGFDTGYALTKNGVEPLIQSP